MRLCTSNEQQQFAASLHDMLAGADTPEVIRAWSAGNHEPGGKVLRELADMGVTGLLVSEKHDGLDAECSDAVVAMETLGYHGVPGPLVETVAVVPTLLAELPQDDLARQWLPALAAGGAIATVAVPPEVPFALDADVAELALCLRGGAVERLDRVAGEPMRSVDAARRLFAAQPGYPEVLFDGDGADALAAAFDAGVLATAAQLHGAGRWLLDQATDYAKQRHQYGKPIGQNQSIKHLLADVAAALEMSRPLLYGAAVAVRDRAQHVPRDVSAAKVAAGKAAYLAARAALQVHGAIGYTAEHDVGLWLTKVRALLGVWGDAAWHRRRVLETVSAPDGEEGGARSDA